MIAREQLLHGLREAGLEVSDEQLDRLEKYAQELLFWNRKFNLVGSGEEELIERHLLDALRPLPLIRERLGSGRRIADVGTGAGLPGIPLAIFLEECSFFLIERSGKRAGFLRSAVVAAGLGRRAEVVHAEVQQCGVEADAVLMRAFRPLPEALPLILPLLAPGGRIFAYHGRRETFAAELEDPLVREFEWDIRSLQSGEEGAERHLLIGVQRQLG